MYVWYLHRGIWNGTPVAQANARRRDVIEVIAVVVVVARPRQKKCPRSNWDRFSDLRVYASSLRAYNTHNIIYDIYYNKVWEVRPDLVKTPLKIYTYLHIVYIIYLYTYILSPYTHIYITREHNNASLPGRAGRSRGYARVCVRVPMYIMYIINMMCTLTVRNVCCVNVPSARNYIYIYVYVCVYQVLS